MKLRIELIEVSDRVRDVQESAVEVIKKSMGELGQQQPIIVRKTNTGKFVLIDGQHRLAAAKRLGWAEVEAEVREFPGLTELESELEAKKIEIETTRGRADRTYCDDLIARDAYLRLVLKRRAVTELKASETEVKKAAEGVRRAREAINEAATDTEKAGAKANLVRLRTIESNALHKRKRAKTRADEVFQALENNVSIPENVKGISSAMREVAEAFGLVCDDPIRRKNRRKQEVANRFSQPLRSVLRGQRIVNGLGIPFLRRLSHTPLNNSVQLAAALEIKKRHDLVVSGRIPRSKTPEGNALKVMDDKYVRYWKCANKKIDRVSKNTAAAFPNFWITARAFRKEEKQNLRDVEREKYNSTSAGQWKRVHAELLAAEKNLSAVDRLLSKDGTDSKLKVKLKYVRRVLNTVSELRTWAG